MGERITTAKPRTTSLGWCSSTTGLRATSKWGTCPSGPSGQKLRIVHLTVGGHVGSLASLRVAGPSQDPAVLDYQAYEGDSHRRPAGGGIVPEGQASGQVVTVPTSAHVLEHAPATPTHRQRVQPACRRHDGKRHDFRAGKGSFGSMFKSHGVARAGGHARRPGANSSKTGHRCDGRSSERCAERCCQLDFPEGDHFKRSMGASTVTPSASALPSSARCGGAGWGWPRLGRPRCLGYCLPRPRVLWPPPRGTARRADLLPN